MGLYKVVQYEYSDKDFDKIWNYLSHFIIPDLNSPEEERLLKERLGKYARRFLSSYFTAEDLKNKRYKHNKGRNERERVLDFHKKLKKAYYSLLDLDEKEASFLLDLDLEETLGFFSPNQLISGWEGQLEKVFETLTPVMQKTLQYKKLGSNPKDMLGGLINNLADEFLKYTKEELCVKGKFKNFVTFAIAPLKVELPDMEGEPNKYISDNPDDLIEQVIDYRKNLPSADNV